MPCKTHEEYQKAVGGDMDEDEHYPDHEEDGYMDDDKKGHTPVHTTQQAVGQIAEDLKDIMKALPKDINAPLPSWWVKGMEMIAKKANKYRDYLVDPKLMDMDKPVETDGWHDDEKGDNRIESTVVSRTFAEHIDALVNEVNEFKQRVLGLAQLRAEKGKRLGKSASEGVARVANTLEDTFRDLDDLLNEGDYPIVEAEVEVEDVIETAEPESFEEAVDIVVEELNEEESVEELSVQEGTELVEETVNLQEEIDNASSEEAFNELFLNTQTAVARALGVQIQDSELDGDDNSE